MSKFAFLQKSALLLCIASTFFIPREASALVGYFEVLGGYGRMQNAGPLLGSAAGGGLGLGGTANGAILIDISSSRRKTTRKSLKFQLGFDHRLIKGAVGEDSYGMQSTYLLGRIQSYSLYVSAGISPYVMTSVAGGSYTAQSGVLGGMVEVAYDLLITPEASFVFSAAAQGMRLSSGLLGPLPTLEFTAGMRFTYGGQPNFSKDNRDYGDYQGERYPYGWEKKR